jgi:hypothetical protein
MANLAFIESAKLVSLLRGVDPKGGMKVRVVSNSRLALGQDPLKPQWIIDFSKEKTSPYEDANQVKRDEIRNKMDSRTPAVASRRRGSYWFELGGHRQSCNSLSDLLRTGLLAFEKHRPGTLDRLSKIKPKSKHIVAHKPEQLFETTHLVEKYSKRLTEGWWMGTNNSADEVKAWLERAAECAELTWGDDYSFGE